MTLELALKLVRDAANYFENNSMFVNGTVDFANLQKDAAFIAYMEVSLKRYGVSIPAQVDSVLAMLPILIQLGGAFKK